MAKVTIEAERFTWETPMSNRVTDVAIVLRESMEELGWAFERERGEHIYTRFAIVLPMIKVAYVFRFRVLKPLPGIVVDTWEMRATHRGDISYLAVKDYRDEDLPAVRELLGELVERLPRRPWDFPLGQRLEAGLVIPEWSDSRRRWHQMGFDSGARTPKEWVPKGTLGERVRQEREGGGDKGSEGDGDGEGDEGDEVDVLPPEAQGPGE
jgi:hypothetical protein